jgi:hypothetical protein
MKITMILKLENLGLNQAVALWRKFCALQQFHQSFRFPTSEDVTALDSERWSKVGLNQRRKCKVKLQPKRTDNPLTTSLAKQTITRQLIAAVFISR